MATMESKADGAQPAKVVVGMPALSGRHRYLDGTPVRLRNNKGICTGACAFNFMACSCVIVGLVLPIVCLAIAGDEDDDDMQYGLHMLALGGFLTGLIVFCFSLEPVWNGAVFNKPVAPPRLKPLKYAFTGRRAGGKLARLRKVLVIVNPGSGVVGTSNDSLALYERFARMAQERGVATVKAETAADGPSFATELVKNFRSDDAFDAVVVIGGDGTLFQCVNGMLQRAPEHRVPLGLIPGGSGNSVLTDLRIKGHDQAGEEQAMENILAGKFAWIDANRVTLDDETQLFSVNELTWGLTGDVGADSEKARCLGPARYDVCAVWGVLRNPTRPIRVTIKDTGKVYEGNMATAFVNQTQHFGKELRAAPAAILDDGLFDLSLMFEQTRGALLKVFALLPTGQHAGNISGTVEMQARHVVFEPANPGVVNIDGENFNYRNTVEIQCVHKALQILMPYDTLCDPPEGYHESKRQVERMRERQQSMARRKSQRAMAALQVNPEAEAKPGADGILDAQTTPNPVAAPAGALSPPPPPSAAATAAGAGVAPPPVPPQSTPAVAAAPTPRVVSATTTSFKVEWDPVPGVDPATVQYRVRIADTPEQHGGKHEEDEGKSAPATKPASVLVVQPGASTSLVVDNTSGEHLVPGESFAITVEWRRKVDAASGVWGAPSATVVAQLKPLDAPAELTESHILTQHAVEFAAGTHELLPSSTGALAAVANLLLSNQGVRVAVQGHVNNWAAHPHKALRLSEARAQAVVAKLLELGVPTNRLEAVGCGIQHPRLQGSSHRNRRVEFVVLPAGSKPDDEAETDDYHRSGNP